MAGENYPVAGVPDDARFPEGYGRDADFRGRGPAGTYRTLPATLEEEAAAGGWLPNATPTGSPESLNRLFTIGMRGEPSFDDDPLPEPGEGRYSRSVSDAGTGRDTD